MNTISLQSIILQQNPISPEVGMPCCEILYTDRYPCTVVEIISKNEIKVKPNFYTVLDYYGERYKVGPINEENPGDVYTLRKNGRWVKKGLSSAHGKAIALNTHAMRIDPSF